MTSNKIGNRFLAQCDGTGSNPSGISARFGICWKCNKIIRRRADGTLRMHGTMEGAIWHSSTQTFVER